MMAHALGQSHIEIAARFGISVQASKQFKARNKDPIAELVKHVNGRAVEEMADLWITDLVSLQRLRQALIEDTLVRRQDADEHRDVSRYNRDVDQLALRASELAGLIKQRTQMEVEHGRASVEIVGLDLAAVTKDWAHPDAPEPSPEPEPEPEPAPAPKAAVSPEVLLGKDEYRRRLREGEPMPSAPPPGFGPGDGEWVLAAD
jgi:hypothetical protein